MVFGIGGNRSFGTVLNDTLGIFGIKGAGLGYMMDSLTGNTTGQLQNLHDMMLETAMGRGSGPIERQMGMFQGMGMGMGMAPFGMPNPMSAYGAMMPLCGAGYAGMTQQVDLAAGSSNIPVLSSLFSPSRRMAGQFERMMRENPYARAAFESQIGGRVVDFGFRNDGRFTVQRFAPGFAPMPGMQMNPWTNNAFGYLSGMNSAALSSGVYGLGNNPFMGYLAGGFNNILGGQYGMGGGGTIPMPMYGASNTVGVGSPSGFSYAGLQTPLGGQGHGSWNPNAAPGQINNTNPAYERAHQAEIDAVLRDPSLTVEDKVTLMIMLIMKKMDQDIERQAQYINSIQQQQSNRGDTGQTGGAGQGGGKGKGQAVGGQGGADGNGSSPSIDVETMKLKRMIDKRSQMFDMLRQIIDKYNQTAKALIDTIGR
jgi:hypothetical protein